MPRLLVVATPIGNLNDLTPRMREALECADLIAAEDTRVTMKLLNHFDLKKTLVSCHRHNEDARAPQLVERMLEEDLTIALTCDAGTPGISDPGHALVAAAWMAGIPVEPVSGPSAVVTALSCAGFDAREFAFYGFLPREKKALLDKLAAIRRTGIPVAVLYESPHRVVELTERIAEAWSGCLLCVCCDLTKRYEAILRGTADEVLAALRANPNVEKGEYCLVADLSALPPERAAETPALTAELFLLSRILEGDDLREAGEAAARAGYARNEIYRARLKVGEFFEDDA